MTECMRLSPTLTVTFSDAVELRREPGGDRWCFGCRKRLPHDDVLYGERTPSYYEPWWARECSRCGKDRTAFGA